jgi:uncharacterized Zn-binding protein involved in type VI secretion
MVKGSKNVEINGQAVVRMCDSGIGETGPCVGRRWKPIMGSATVLANGRPLVRRNDATQHYACGPGVVIDGSPNVEAGGASAEPNQATVDAVVKYIYDEMIRNKEDARTQAIRTYNQRFLQSMEPNPYGMGTSSPDWYSFYRAMDEWKDLVGYDKLWDHKSFIRKEYGEYSYDLATNTSLPFDTWSNIHYGFVGEAAGFDQGTLLNGAGLAQWLNDHPNASRAEKLAKYAGFMLGGTADYDLPEDREAIRIGTALWKKYEEEGTLTEQDVKNAVMNSTNLLGALTGPVCC